MRDLSELTEVSPSRNLLRWSPRRFFDSDLALAEDVLMIVSGRCPEYVIDAICKWIQDEGGPNV
jgi:hypothetical protein